jgi:hypothetical protein
MHGDYDLYDLIPRGGENRSIETCATEKIPDLRRHGQQLVADRKITSALKNNKANNPDSFDPCFLQIQKAINTAISKHDGKPMYMINHGSQLNYLDHHTDDDVTVFWSPYHKALDRTLQSFSVVRGKPGIETLYAKYFEGRTPGQWVPVYAT